MFTMIAAISLLVAVNGAVGPPASPAPEESTEVLLSAPVGDNWIFRLLEISSDETSLLIDFLLESVDGVSTNRTLKIADDGTAILMRSDTGEPLFGYNFHQESGKITLEVTYAGRTASITKSSDEEGPIDLAFLLGSEESLVHFDAMAELDIAVELLLAVEDGTRSVRCLDSQEEQLVSKARALRLFASRFLAAE